MITEKHFEFKKVDFPNVNSSQFQAKKGNYTKKMEEDMNLDEVYPLK